MIVENTTKEIISILKKSKLSTDMKSLEVSEWIVLEDKDNEIIGAAGIGGMFHTSSININKKSVFKTVKKSKRTRSHILFYPSSF